MIKHFEHIHSDEHGMGCNKVGVLHIETKEQCGDKKYLKFAQQLVGELVHPWCIGI